MVIKVILIGTIGVLLSCSTLVDKRKADSCTVVDDPAGKHGTLRVGCPELSFTILYDNTPDGRDPLILEITGVEAKRISGKRTYPYRKETGDYELLSGWAYEEEWRVGDFKLKALEYFVNGGTGCYEEEEVAKIDLYLREERITLLDFYEEETDCGGN